MKLAVTGKGGVGKTTVAARLARILHARGRRVVAIDADPDANLAGTLGHRGEEITPLVKLKPIIEERVGDGVSAFLRMNPRVDDIPERFGVVVDGIRVLVMGTIERGRRGCACPENVFLREVLTHLLLEEDEDVVVDMEAGVEHLGRGTAEAVDRMVVVVEPGWASLVTAGRVFALARDLKIPRVDVVANRVRSPEDLAYIGAGLGGAALLGALPHDPGLETDARSGARAVRGAFDAELERIAERLLGA
jgi:CO dehydrogenase maturation factor